MSLVENAERLSCNRLLQLARNAKGEIKAIYLHWTAGRYGQLFDDYHINIDHDGKVYLTCQELTELKAHTWKHNTGAIGVTLCCCYEAVYNADSGAIDYGPYPPTELQLESLVKVVQVLCKGLELMPTLANVKTHYEQAVIDRYGPGQDSDCRWDLMYLYDKDYPINNHLRLGGELIRSKARGEGYLQDAPREQYL